MTGNNIRVGESSSGASPSSKHHMLSGAECGVPTEIRSSSSSVTTEQFSTSDDSSIQYSSSYANDLDSVTRGMTSMGGATILPAADDDDAAAASPAASSAATSSGGRPKLLHAKSYSELKWTEAPLEAPTDLAESFHEAIDAENNATSPPKRLPLEAATTALLVVDVQPQYWSECASVRKDFPHFPQKLAQTIKTCRQRGAKLIFVRADYRYSHSPWLAQFERLHGGRPDMRAEVPCDPNDDEFAWEDFATPEGGDIILPKTSWSSSSNPKLMQWLRGAGIETVLVCGLITSVCVQHSAFSIFEAGFRTLLVTDACGDRGRARHDAALALYGGYMYELVTADDLDDPETGLVKAKPVWLSLDAGDDEEGQENKGSSTNKNKGVRSVQETVLRTGQDRTGATVVFEN